MNTLTIPAFSAEAAEAAQRHLDNLAKVPRSLGRLEELAVRLAGCLLYTSPSPRDA